MTSDQIATVLEDAGLFGRGVLVGDFVRFPCPFRKWRHKIGDTQAGNAYWIRTEDLSGGCFVCGESASLWEVLYWRGLFDGQSVLKRMGMKILKETVAGPQGDVEKAFAAGEERTGVAKPRLNFWKVGALKERYEMMARTHEAMAEYVARRTGNVHSIARYSLRYDVEEKRVCLPLWDLAKDGDLIGLIGRSVVDGVPIKAKGYPGTVKTLTFGVSSFVDFWLAKEFLVIEGQYDMFKCQLRLDHMNMHEVCAISLNGSVMSEEQAALLSIRYRPMMVMLDADAAGRKGDAIILEKLTDKVPVIRMIALPEKPECYDREDGSDPDLLKEAVFQTLIKETRK